MWEGTCRNDNALGVFSLNYERENESSMPEAVDD